MKKKLKEILQYVVNDGFIIQLSDFSTLIATTNSRIFEGSNLLVSKVGVYTPQFFSTSVESQEMVAVEVSPKDIIEALEDTKEDNKEDTDFSGRQMGRKSSGANVISWKLSSFEKFKSDFNLIQDKINKNELEKAVPITEERTNWIPNVEERLNSLRNVLRNTKNQRVYGYFTNSEGLIGITPEVLFERDGQQIKTMALAGTQLKSEGILTSSLLEDEKELSEHQFVIEKVKKTLETFGEVKVEKTQVVELPNLWHLRTEIHCHLNAKLACNEIDGDKKLIELLHPTPALGIFSSHGTNWNWLQNLSHQNERHRFGAPIGFSSSNKSLILVGIRCLQWNSGGSKIFSGCGIVRQSQLEKEWNELHGKRQSVKAILGLV